ncbi:MAG: type II secretion system minor pseudopilin GspI [Porticoccaceae bacterium]|nr:type II secretion system minor pseudopilin GspI [Porticoccaceae bacterium]
MKNTRKARGFTLIEVAVALAILSWVLSSALFLVHQYSDERLKLRERFFATQVSWNRLLERYQYAQGWVPQSERTVKTSKGIDKQAGQNWRWQLTSEAAMGQDLFRYEVKSGRADGEQFTGTLAIYLVGDGQ